MTNEEFTASADALIKKCNEIEARMIKLETAIKRERNLALDDIRRQADRKLNELRRNTRFYHENN